MPSAPGERVRAIVEYLGRLKIPCRTVPSSQWVEGEIISALRPVEIGDVGTGAGGFGSGGLENFYAGECVGDGGRREYWI